MSIATARIVGLDTAGIRRTRAELEGATERLPHVVPVAPDLGMIVADDGGTVLSAAALQALGWTDADVLQAAVEVAQQQAVGEIAVVQPGTVVVQDPDLAVLVVAAPSSLQGIDLDGAPVLFPRSTACGRSCPSSSRSSPSARRATVCAGSRTWRRSGKRSEPEHRRPGGSRDP